jgi:exosortase A
VAYAGLALMMALAMSGAVVGMAKTGWSTVTYNHIFVVPLVSAYLIWQRRDALAREAPRPAPLALAGLTGVALVWLVALAGEVMLGQQLALVGGVIALFVAVFGWRVARLVWFPLAFLIFAVPMGDSFVPALQDLTAEVSVGLLRASNIPTFHEGTLILLPNGAFEVAEACAGLRFIIANLAIAALFCYLAFRRWWKWLVFMALAVLIPIAANALRAYGIMVVAHLTDNEYAAGVDHLVYGWGFFTLVMFLLIGAGTLFADRRPSLPAAPEGADDAPRPAVARVRYGPVVLLAAGAILLPAAYGHAMMSGGAAAGGLPAFPEPLRAAGEDPTWRPTARGAAQTRQVALGRGVALFLAHYPRQTQGAEAVQHGNRLFGDDWARTGAGAVTLSDGGQALTLRGMRLGRGEARRLIAYGYWMDGAWVRDPVAVKLRQALGRLRLAEPAVTLVALAAPYDRSPAEARARMTTALARAFEADGGLRGYLRRLGPGAAE